MSVLIGFPNRKTLQKADENKQIYWGAIRFDEPQTVESVHIGRNVLIYPYTVIYPNVKLGDNVFIAHNCIIRDGCQIGSGTRIGNMVVLEPECRIGRNVSIQPLTLIAPKTIIGDNCFIGALCGIASDKYPPSASEKLWKPVVIERNVALGHGVTVVPGVTIKSNVAVGAGSVVTKTLKSGFVYAGCPAEKMGSFKEYRRKQMDSG
jgi:hypothetical protein